MTTAYTSLLGLALPVTGELSGTWGTVVNDSITSLLDSAISGTTNVSTDADVTLTTTTGAANTAREAILLFSGARTALRTVTAPAQSKVYTVINATTGGYSVKLVGAGPTTGVTIVAGESAVCAWNGSDFVKVSNTSGAGVFTSITNTGLTSGRVVYSTTGGLETDSANLTFNGTTLTANTLNLTNALGTTYGGTGLTSFTANGVLYASSSSALATGAGLIWTGGTAQLGFQNAAANGYAYIGNAGAGTNTDLAFYMGASEGMRLTSTGLGIGTSSPAYPLDVVASSASFGISLRGRSSDNIGTLGFFTNNGATNDVQLQMRPSDNEFRILVAGARSQTFYTNGSERMRLDSSGNLGLGVTPSASTFPAIESSVGIFTGRTENNIGVNTYYSSGWKYIASSIASRYSQNGGQHQFFTAPSGTAGNAITFTQAMTLDASGNLGIGTTSPTFANGIGLQVNYSGGLGSHIKLTDSASGSGATDGFDLYGYNTNGYVENYEAGSIVFRNNGAERARIDSSGNFGIGTSSPAQKLVVQGASGSAAISITDATYTSYVATISSNGNYGNGSLAGQLYLRGQSGIGFSSVAGASTQMALDTSGNLLVGTTSNPNSCKLVVSGINSIDATTSTATGTCYVGNYTGTSGTVYYGNWLYNGAGVGYISSTGTITVYSTTSDYRLKNTIAPMIGALAKVALLKPVTYKWNCNGSDGQGFIAHELAEVVPDCVTGAKDAVDADGKPIYQGIDVSFLVATLTAAIQEQQAIIESLKARLDAANL